MGRMKRCCSKIIANFAMHKPTGKRKNGALGQIAKPPNIRPVLAEIQKNSRFAWFWSNHTHNKD